jgi:sugar phosphate isomerase/epimerase
MLRQTVEELGPDRAAICLDTANSLGALEGLDTVVRELGPFAVNLHVKDVRIYRVWHQMGFEVEGTPAGQGMVPIPELLQQLRGFGFQGTVILEHWPAPLEDENALRELEERWTRESLAYLRPLLATDR